MSTLPSCDGDPERVSTSVPSPIPIEEQLKRDIDKLLLGCYEVSLVRRLDAANSSSGSWDATRTQSQDNNLYVVRPILPTSTEHTRYIAISL
jgi:hypothetical protein